MSATETIRDLVRIATTAGLAKDVIDLLERKTALLAQQVTALEQESATLLRENRNLKLENENLNAQLQKARPKGDELATKTRDILVYYFKKAGDISDREIAQRFQMDLSTASYHTDILFKKQFIEITRIGFGDAPAMTGVAPEGRKYVVENGLV